MFGACTPNTTSGCQRREHDKLRQAERVHLVVGAAAVRKAGTPLHHSVDNRRTIHDTAARIETPQDLPGGGVERVHVLRVGPFFSTTRVAPQPGDRKRAGDQNFSCLDELVSFRPR